MFGGRLEWLGDSIAETTILRLGERVDSIHCIAISCTVIESVLRGQGTVPTPHHLLLLY